jgi:hypothetical protein
VNAASAKGGGVSWTHRLLMNHQKGQKSLNASFTPRERSPKAYSDKDMRSQCPTRTSLFYSRQATAVGPVSLSENSEIVNAENRLKHPNPWTNSLQALHLVNHARFRINY